MKAGDFVRVIMAEGAGITFIGSEGVIDKELEMDVEGYRWFTVRFPESKAYNHVSYCNFSERQLVDIY